MDQMRLLAALVLSFLVFMAWNFFFNPEPKQPPVAKLQQEARVEEIQKPQPPVTAAQAGAAPAAVVKAEEQRPARKFTVETPFYIAGLTEKGASINSFVLKNYRSGAAPDSPMQDLLPGGGGLNSIFADLAGVPGLENAVFQANFEGDRLSLTEGSRDIVFTSTTADGVQLEKVYRFSADSYVIGFDVRVANGSAKPLKDSLIVGLRNALDAKKSSYVFEGPAALVDKSLQQIELDDIAKKGNLSGKIKWISVEGRYFMLGLIPLKDQAAAVRISSQPNHVVESRYIEPEQTLGPGTQESYQYELYFGPKSMQYLKAAGHDMDKVIDFGTFDLLAKPLLWLLNYIYSVIPNYGVAIIILTILTKILLWPLGTKSYKSMSQMKKMQPLIQEMREKYKDDRKKMNEAIMGLHRTYGINPLGGCLPMIVQIPFFFALYRMLDQAIELRHAPFFGWINDLSAPDRLFDFGFSIPFMDPPYGIPVLTIIMGATMIWQQKMTPSTGDPTQAKMMMMMPVVFTFIFINFSSGLVLYWLVNNVLSIGQQIYTQKKFG
jgi:YidC/Oxa1 family membrane protein insertase